MLTSVKPTRLLPLLATLLCFLALARPAPALAQTFYPSVQLSEAGWSEPVGTWDPVTRTAVLTQDVTSTIEIEADSLVLDGGGHRVWGTSAVGVYLNGRSDVTVTRLSVGPFQTGVLFQACTRCAFTAGDALALGTDVRIAGGSGNSVTDSSFLWAGHGETVAVEASGTTGVTIAGNTTSWASIRLYSSTAATVSGNTVEEVASGIYLERTDHSRITGNTARLSDRGIHLVSSNDNLIDRNILPDDRLAGLLLTLSARNTARENVISRAELTGLWMEDSSDNRFYHNDMLANWAWQAYVVGGTGNVFNLPRPDGGNHWSDWTSPDADSDGFVDLPYVFAGGSDDLPFTAPDGWLTPKDTAPPVTSAVVEPASPDGYAGWYVNAPTIALSATDVASAVAATYYRWDDGTDATYTAPLIAAEGAHTLRFHSVDSAGNVEGEQAVELKVDTIAPPPPVITQPADGSSQDGSVTVGGTAEAGALIIVFEGDSLLATVQADALGEWSTPPLTLAEGEHTIVVAAADEAGNMLIPSSVVTFVRRVSAIDFTTETASEGRYGEDAVLSARLTDSSGALGGREVEFKLGPHSYRALTGADGTARVTARLDEQPGTYQLEAGFAGDRESRPAVGRAPFDVLKRPTSLVYLGETRLATGSVAHIEGRLSDADATAAPPQGRLVRFTIGSRVVTATTDAQGVAAVDVELALPAGIFDVVAGFEGDVWYEASAAAPAELVVYDPYSGLHLQGTALVEQGGSSARVKTSVSYASGASAPSGYFAYRGRPYPAVESSSFDYLLFSDDSATLTGAGTFNGAPGYTFTAVSIRAADGTESFSLTVRDADASIVFSNTGTVLQGGLRVR